MNISMDDYSSYGGMISDQSVKAETLKNKLSGDFSKVSDGELMEVCREFESYFLEQTFKAMEKMIPKDEEEDSSGANSTLDMFKDNLIQEYASSATEGEGLGLAQILYEQMKRNYKV